MSTPCNKCPKRYVTRYNSCHDVCKEYRDFREEREAIREERFRQSKATPIHPPRDKRGRAKK